MAVDVIQEDQDIICPHCKKKIVLSISTNVYEFGEYGKPDISVDEEKSVKVITYNFYIGKNKRSIKARR